MGKILLTILDGWGENTETIECNAIEQGKTPTWHEIIKNNPSNFLKTFGEDVGLTKGQMGNSEVGHTNIGAGRIVFQDLPRINNSIKDKSFENNEYIKNTIKDLKVSKKTIHIMGLFSNGGVHAHIDHFFYCLELFAKQDINVKLHLFLDGRDTPPKSAINYSDDLNKYLKKYQNVNIGSICGRYYAMDRDNRWDRIEKAYNAIVLADGNTFSSYKDALNESYKNDIEDEFFVPEVCSSYKGMEDGDSILITNYRSDRARQLLNALVNKDFKDFQRKKIVNFKNKLGMVSYSDSLDKFFNTLFPNDKLVNTLGEYLSKNNLKQLRMAETEKYPHVTFFFSGGKEEPFKNEDRILKNSPKVATYDLKPEMAAFELTDSLLEALDSNKYDFILINYANGDMVGHTGKLEAAKKATEAVDKCLKKVKACVEKNNYIWIIIADHGNVETMWDYKNNAPHTQHTTNLVRITLVNSKYKNVKSGKLADIAPTVLKILGLDIPKEMDGNSLI